jgi:hypothetical protein
MAGINYILCFEDFYQEPEIDLNEASQDTIKRIQGEKVHYQKKVEHIKKKQQDSAEEMSKIKDRASKTKDPLVAKIYQARSSEEKIKQQMYKSRLDAVQQAARVADQKLTVANLRLQNKTKKKL